MKSKKPISMILLLTLCLSMAIQQALAQSKTDSSVAAVSRISSLTLLARVPPGRRAGFSLIPSSRYASGRTFNTTPGVMAVSPPAVLGGGTVGNISLWVGTHPSGNSILGDSIITQLNGNIGIGLPTPTSKLSVQGMIETTLGGYKFPDGTIQTTAAVSGLTSIFHDATLTGTGTSGSSLGVAVPLALTGAVPPFIGAVALGVIKAVNTAEFGVGVRAVGGSHGDGVNAIGGNSTGNFNGGGGVEAFGGSNFSGNGTGGDAVAAIGGTGSGAGQAGGGGIFAAGGAGQNGAVRGLAGSFDGDVAIVGNLSKSGGSFKIDHPLDPENKYLYHSFVESPDMMNIYNGNIATDENGDAVVELPAYFAALNKDFRYQLTVIGTFAQAIVADEIKDNRFTIKTNAANVRVSWQVTGIRQDAYANKNRIKVEEDKPVRERGSFLHPEVFGQPEERGIEWARYPQMMQQMKESRLKQIEELKRKSQSNDR